MLTAGMHRAALAWVVTVTVFYAVAVVPVTTWLGASAGPLSALPVAFAAAMLGRRGGIAVALLCFPINTVALNLAGFPGWDTMFRHGGVPGLIALLTIAWLIGWLRWLVLRLRMNEARLRALYDGSPLPTFDWRRTGDDFVLTDYNAAAATAYGGAATRLVGVRCREFHRDRPEVLADFTRCFAERGTFRREYSYKSEGSGERKRVATTYVFIPPETVLAQIEDITASVEIDEMRAHLATVVAASHDAILSQDLTGAVLSWNSGTERLYGYAATEILGRSVARLIPPELIDEGQAIRDRLARGEIVANYETVRRRKDGQLFDVSLTLAPLRDAADRIVGISATAQDISEHKAAEAALRRSEASLATAQRIAHLGSWEHDLVADRLSWSDECFRIAGHAPGAFEPSTERALAAMHPDDRERVTRARQGSIEGELPYMIEHRLLRPDGEVRLVRQQAETIRDATGRAVRRIGIIQDITEQRALEAQLAHQANHDTLTGLPNRTLLLDRLGQALARGRRDGSTCAIIFLDLDNFKDVNDTLGHDAGDRLLIAVTGRLGAVLRESDTLARLGGDEFTALLETVADQEEAEAIAGRLADALAAPFALAGRDRRITASLGVVLATDRHTRPEDVLRDADVALYCAKDAGRAGHAVFDPAMQAAAAARVALEQDLAHAVGYGELLLHYQPIVALHTGRVVKAEALVRWQHPERGLIPPGDFVPVAEATGLIAPLGRWVLHEACRQAAAWCAAGTPLPVSVNLTAREFQNPRLVGEVAAALAASGLPADCLWLEITEGAAMGDAATTVASLRALKALGVRLAIDDFGTGYSSLAYLKRFPVDALKIDRAFVDGLGIDPEDTAIVEAIVTMARILGLNVIAEGVESGEQATRLRALGCAQAQGFYFSQPLPPGEFNGFLACAQVSGGIGACSSATQVHALAVSA